MKKLKSLSILAIAAIALVCAKMTNLAVSTPKLENVEALGSCESRGGGGYNMDNYCIDGTGRCYLGDFVSENCISNRV